MESTRQETVTIGTLQGIIHGYSHGLIIWIGDLTYAYASTFLGVGDYAVECHRT